MNASASVLAAGAAPADPAHPGRRIGPRGIGALAAAVAFASLAGFAAGTYLDHEATLERARRDAERSAEQLHDEAVRSLRASRIVTDRLIELASVHALDHFRSPDGWSALTSFAGAVSEIDSLWIADADGRLVANSLEFRPPPADFSDRPYFAPLRDGADLYLGGLFHGRISGVWFFGYNRAIRIDGEFRGLVQAALHAESFAAFYRGLNLGPGSHINLYRADGLLLMRSPLAEEDEGATVAGLPLWRDHLSQAPAGVTEFATPAGERRIVAWRRLADSGVVATVGLARAAVLAPFYARLARNGAFLALGLLLLGSLAALAAAALKRDAREAALLRESAERTRRVLNQLFAFVGTLTPDGTLLDANQAPLQAAGLTLDDVRGRKFWDCYWWSYDPAVQDRLRQAVTRAAAGETVRYDVPVRVAGGTIIIIDFQIAPLRDEAGRITHLIPSAMDVSERTRTEEELRRTSELLKTIGDNTPELIYVKDREGRIVYANPATLRAIGKDRAEVYGQRDVDWHDDPAEAEALMRIDQRIMSSGQGETVEEFVTGPLGLRAYLSTKSPLRDETGRVAGLVGVSVDITERKALEKRQTLLMAEVDHRAKNVLAVVQAMIGMTRADSVAGFKAALNGRIAALARAHLLLAQSRWLGADLDRVVAEELAPYGDADGRIAIGGPPVRLTPEAAQALAMTLHELATNAAKHGALAAPEGRLDLRWRLDAPADGRGLHLTWRERGGPPTSPPTRRGFGTTVIEQSIRHQLGGDSALDWPAEGLTCRLRIPARHLQPSAPTPRAADAQAPAQPPPQAAAALSAPLDGEPLRVLVVEDNALVALDLEASLRERRYAVVGPAGSLAEAFELARTSEFDLAVLDLDLGGEKSYPLADALAARGIPFCFATGYERDTGLSGDYAAVALIRKPYDIATLDRTLRSLAADRRVPQPS